MIICRGVILARFFVRFNSRDVSPEVYQFLCCFTSHVFVHHVQCYNRPLDNIALTCTINIRQILLWIKLNMDHSFLIDPTVEMIYRIFIFLVKFNKRLRIKEQYHHSLLNLLSSVSILLRLLLISLQPATQQGEIERKSDNSESSQWHSLFLVEVSLRCPSEHLQRCYRWKDEAEVSSWSGPQCWGRRPRRFWLQPQVSSWSDFGYMHCTILWNLILSIFKWF
jgi:hypothetical protein